MYTHIFSRGVVRSVLIAFVSCRILNFITSLFFLLLLSSCGIIMKKLSGFPNSQVYADTEVNTFMDSLSNHDNVIDSYFLERIDSVSIVSTMFLGSESRAFVANKNLDFLCTDQSSISCSAVQLDNIKETSIDKTFFVCDEKTYKDDIFQFETAKELLDNLTLSTAANNEIKTAEYLVFYFWSHAFDKENSQEYWDEFYESFENEEDIKIIRINTDLRESWNLRKGKKIRIRLRKKKGADRQYNAHINKVPFQK